MTPLFDEPTAGLDASESEWLGERIRAISGTGTGVLLVDHDVALVLRICDYIYVLDYGRVIAEGTPETIREDRAVAEAYIGGVREVPGDGGMTARLRCEGLTGGHGATTAFRSVDLEVEPGMVLTVLGSNGSGKTSLLMTLAGLLRAHEGSVQIDGRAMRNGHASVANHAGLVFVPDSRCLSTRLTVEDNLRVATRRGGPPLRQVTTAPSSWSSSMWPSPWSPRTTSSF